MCLVISQLQVETPESDGIVFDVEILVKEGQFPTMATAVSPNAWLLFVLLIHLFI